MGWGMSLRDIAAHIKEMYHTGINHTVRSGVEEGLDTVTLHLPPGI